MKPPRSCLARGASAVLCRRFPRALEATRAGIVGALALSAIAACVDSHANRLILLQGNDSPRLSRTLDALQKHVGMPVEIVFLANTSETAWQSTLATAEPPAAVVALGPHASDFIVRMPPHGGPVVHCLAGHDALRAGLPSLPSEVPADTQAFWLRRLLPAARTVGLAFDPAKNARRAEAISAALAAAGYKTLMTPVRQPSALPAALEQIAARADVLLALPDPIVYTGESARGILLQSFRRRKPVIGPNEAWVRMGALYAVDWDYDEVGAKCAQLVLREVQSAHSTPADTVPYANGDASPKPKVSVNLRSASEFGLHWSAEVLRGVDVRHE